MIIFRKLFSKSDIKLSGNKRRATVIRNIKIAIWKSFYRAFAKRLNLRRCFGESIRRMIQNRWAIWPAKSSTASEFYDVPVFPACDFQVFTRTSHPLKTIYQCVSAKEIAKKQIHLFFGHSWHFENEENLLLYFLANEKQTFAYDFIEISSPRESNVQQDSDLTPCRVLPYGICTRATRNSRKFLHTQTAIFFLNFSSTTRNSKKWEKSSLCWPPN